MRFMFLMILVFVVVTVGVDNLLFHGSNTRAILRFLGY